MLNDSPESVRKVLQDGIAKGYWTLETLDRPSAGWAANTRVDSRTFPDGYRGIEHRNLLRDYHPERPQATPDPRDFASDPRANLPADGAQVSPAEPRVDHSIDDLDPVSWDEL